MSSITVVSWPAPIWYGGENDGEEAESVTMDDVAAGAVRGHAITFSDGELRHQMRDLPVAYGRVFFDVPPPLAFRVLSADCRMARNQWEQYKGDLIADTINEVLAAVLDSAGRLIDDGWWLDLPVIESEASPATDELTITVTIDCARPRLP